MDGSFRPGKSNAFVVCYYAYYYFLSSGRRVSGRGGDGRATTEERGGKDRGKRQGEAGSPLLLQHHSRGTVVPFGWLQGGEGDYKGLGSELSLFCSSMLSPLLGFDRI